MGINCQILVVYALLRINFIYLFIYLFIYFFIFFFFVM